MKKKDIAVVILNYIQYTSIKLGLDELRKKGYSIDVYCPDSNLNNGFKELFENTQSILSKSHFELKNKVDDTFYKVLLEPYPSMNINSKYKIRYRYGMISAKPNVVYIPRNYIQYDGILCAGSYDANYLSVFSKTYQVSNLKFINFNKKKKIHDKKVLLYLPTYGHESSIELISEKIKSLRKKYYVIVKIHHGTTFLKDESNRIELLKSCVDEYYDCFKDLKELLEISDVVLTDNSSVIFEALFVNVPVAVFSNDINQNKLENFNTTQYELYKKGVLPFTNNSDNIEKIIDEALSSQYIKKQKEWATQNLFYTNYPVKSFTDVIESYLHDKIDMRYYEFHKIFSDHYYDMEKKICDLEKLALDFQNNNKNLIGTINALSIENQKLTSKLEVYKNSKLYILATKIYSFISVFRKKKKGDVK